MKVIGLTGGIGSGKSTVLYMFQDLGAAVYMTDKVAKRILETSERVRAKIISLLGESAYTKTLPNRKFIAEVVFYNPSKLKALNAIVHPEVANDFQSFLQAQNAPYVIYESALLFETDSNKNCDEVVLVTAPTAVKIERIQKRDLVSEVEIFARMNNQMTDSEKIPLADHVLENTTLESLEQQVLSLHQLFVKDL
ncbi:dephospho-CoA kinase [Flavicella sp.]|nr:dephospho-CoA kinase [Flavicella sp.]MDA9111534.1 dephospho-CoA kinase [Flavicella sp.]